MAQKTKKISYIKKPMARNGFICLGLAAVALFLCLTGLGISIRNQGNTPVGGTAVCFSSFLFAVFGVIYGWASFQEEEKNYILAKIGAPISGLDCHFLDCAYFNWIERVIGCVTKREFATQRNSERKTRR